MVLGVVDFHDLRGDMGLQIAILKPQIRENSWARGERARGGGKRARDGTRQHDVEREDLLRC